MTFRITDEKAGTQAIAETSTTAKHEVGTIVRAVDETLGEGEFIYLLGVASTVIGDIVTYDVAGTNAFQTALATTAADAPRPLAVAMSANVASQYGWYQISGLAVVAKANTLSRAASTYFAAASGKMVAAASAGLNIQGAIVAVVASAKSDVTTVQVMTNRPTGPVS